MVRINVTKKNEEPLRFILTMFLETHERDKIIYSGEFKIAKKILEKLNSDNKPQTKEINNEI